MSFNQDSVFPECFIVPGQDSVPSIQNSLEIQRFVVLIPFALEGWGMGDYLLVVDLTATSLTISQSRH